MALTRDPRRLIAGLALVLTASLAVRAQDTIQSQEAAPFAPAQPIPYSHKKHLAFGLTCATCHVNPGAGKLMTYPATATCMTCHQALATDRPAIQKLASYAASGTPVPWVRVYQTPDYVFWQHGTHLAAEVTCVECHGPVADRDIIARETNVATMAGCLECHNKRQVYTDCGHCHEPRSAP